MLIHFDLCFCYTGEDAEGESELSLLCTSGCFMGALR